MLARLRGMMQTLKSNDPPPGKVDENRTELLPTWDIPKFAESSPPPAPDLPDDVAPVPVEELPTSPPVEDRDPIPGQPASVEPEPTEGVGGILCQACCAVNPVGQTYCESCGWISPLPELHHR